MSASEEARVADVDAHENGTFHYSFHDLSTDDGFTAACDQAMSSIVLAALHNDDIEHIAESLFNVDDEVAAAVMDAIHDELLCYNCLGFGHRAVQSAHHPRLTASQ